MSEEVDWQAALNGTQPARPSTRPRSAPQNTTSRAAASTPARSSTSVSGTPVHLAMLAARSTVTGAAAQQTVGTAVFDETVDDRALRRQGVD
jgi:hypothetical protein